MLSNCAFSLTVKWQFIENFLNCFIFLMMKTEWLLYTAAATATIMTISMCENLQKRFQLIFQIKKMMKRNHPLLLSHFSINIIAHQENELNSKCQRWIHVFFKPSIEWISFFISFFFSAVSFSIEILFYIFIFLWFITFLLTS